MAEASDSAYTLVVTASDYSTLTGHHQFTCYIEETQADGTVIRSTPEVWGIEVSALQSRFANDINQWRDWVQTQMQTRHLTRMAVHKEILGWAGQRYAITPFVAPIVVPPKVLPVPQWQRRKKRKK
jgi:hypothetical protein